jgi:hypothetical protein
LRKVVKSHEELRELGEGLPTIRTNSAHAYANHREVKRTSPPCPFSAFPSNVP